MLPIIMRDKVTANNPYLHARRNLCADNRLGVGNLIVVQDKDSLHLGAIFLDGLMLRLKKVRTKFVIPELQRPHGYGPIFFDIIAESTCSHTEGAIDTNRGGAMCQLGKECRQFYCLCVPHTGEYCRIIALIDLHPVTDNLGNNVSTLL